VCAFKYVFVTSFGYNGYTKIYISLIHELYMVKLSAQREGRLTRTQRVQEKQEQQAVAVENERRRVLKEKIDSASENLKSTTYENYDEEYNKLDPETKTYFTSPEELKQTEGYKEYAQKKKEYDQAVAYQNEYNRAVASIKKASSRGTVWLIAMWGEGIEKQLARDYMKMENAQKDAFVNKVSTWNKENPTEKLIVDWKNYQVTGVESGSLQQSIPFADYNKIINDTSITNNAKFNVSLDPLGQPVSTIPKTDNLQVNNPDVEKVAWYNDLTEKGRTAVKENVLKPIGSFLLDKGKIVLSEGTKLYKKIPTAEMSISSPSFSNLYTGFNLFGSKDGKDIKVSRVKEVIVEDLDRKIIEQQNIELQKIGIDNIRSEYGGKAQSSFDTNYAEGIYSGDISFEDAVYNFEKSEEYKNILKDYNLEVRTEINKLEITGGTLKTMGYRISKTGVNILPTNTRDLLAFELSGAVGGAGALKVLQVGKAVIPSAYLTGANIGTSLAIGGYGGRVYRDPLSSPSERLSGLINVGLGFGSVGFAGVKILGRQTFSKKVVNPTISDLQTYTLGTEGKYIKEITLKGSTSQFETVNFARQKLSTFVEEGSLVQTSRLWRDLLRKYTPIKPNFVSQGLPFEKVAPTQTYDIFGKKYTVEVGKSVYQKELNVAMKQFGLTETQARSLLSYNAPAVKNLVLDVGELSVYKEKGYASGRFQTTIYQDPSIFAFEGRILKTRGKKPITDVYNVDRYLEGDVMVENIVKQTMDKNLRIKGKSKTEYLRISYGDTSEIKELLRRSYWDIGGKQYSKTIPYKYQDIFSYSGTKQLNPLKRKIKFDTSKTGLLKVEEKLLKTLDLDALMGVSYDSSFLISPAKIKKTPFSSTFGSKEMKKIKDLIKSSSSQTSVVKEVSNKINSQQLKSAINPIIKDITPSNFNMNKVITNKQFAGVREIGTFGVGFNVKSMHDTKLNIKSITKLNSDLKSQIKAKDLIKEDSRSRLKQSQSMKQVQALKSPQKLKSSIIELTGLDFTQGKIIRTPPSKNISKPFALPFSLPDLKKKSKKKKKGKFEEFAYLPDFTSRSLGLNPEVISGKQAQAKIQKVLTGLELRRGVIIR